jgi:hypothetical protein
MDLSEISLASVQELHRQAETCLSGTVQLAIAADQGIFGAGSVALLAAVATILAAASPNNPFIGERLCNGCAVFRGGGDKRNGRGSDRFSCRRVRAQAIRAIRRGSGLDVALCGSGHAGSNRFQPSSPCTVGSPASRRNGFRGCRDPVGSAGFQRVKGGSSLFLNGTLGSGGGGRCGGGDGRGVEGVPPGRVGSVAIGKTSCRSTRWLLVFPEP